MLFYEHVILYKYSYWTLIYIDIWRGQSELKGVSKETSTE